MDDDTELSQQKVPYSYTSNNYRTQSSKYTNCVIDESDSSQEDYLYLDPNDIKQTVGETPTAQCDNNKNFENDGSFDAPQTTENAQTFKTLLREVCLTTNMLYKAFKKAYHKSKNESFNYAMDSVCKMKQSKPSAPYASATTKAYTCNKEIIGDTIKKSQYSGKSKAKCKSNSNKLANIYIEPFKVTIPLKLLVEFGSKGTPKRHKCNVCIAGRHQTRKYRSEEPLRTSGKCDVQKSDIFLSCASSEEFAYFQKPTIGQVRQVSDVIRTRYSSKYGSGRITSLHNRTEQDFKASDIAESICICKMRKENLLNNLRNKTEQFISYDVRQSPESKYPTKAGIFTAKAADGIQQIVMDADVSTCLINRKELCDQKLVIPGPMLISSQELLTDNLLDIVQQEKESEQYKSAYAPTDELTEMIVDVDKKTVENLNETYDTAASPQQINLPTPFFTNQINEFQQQSIQKQLENINLSSDMKVSQTLREGNVTENGSTSPPEKMQSQRPSLSTNLQTQMDDIEVSRLQADAYQTQLEDLEYITSDKQEKIRKGSPIDTTETTLPVSTISTIKQNGNLEDQQRQKQDWGSIEEVAEKLPEEETTKVPEELIEKLPEELAEKLPEEELTEKLPKVTEKVREEESVQVPEIVNVPYVLNESVPKTVTEKFSEKMAENILEKKIQDDSKRQPPIQQSDATQTDVSSFRVRPAQRLLLQQQIIETLRCLVITTEVSNITTEDRNIMLHDLWTIFSLNTRPTLQDDDINSNAVEHIKYLLAYLPQDLRHDVPIDFNISDEPTIKATIDDLRHILYTKTLLADGHYYSKESSELILKYLNDLLQPPSSLNTPLDPQSRESIIHSLKRLLSIGAKGKEGRERRAIHKGVQTEVDMKASESTSLNELSENALIQRIPADTQQLEESELLEKLNECEEVNEEVNPRGENIDLNISKSITDTNDIDYEPANKRQKIDVSLSNIATTSTTNYKERHYVKMLDSSHSTIPINISITSIKTVSKDNLESELDISKRDSISKTADDENINSKGVNTEIDKVRDIEFSPEASFIQQESSGLRRSSAFPRRRSVLPSYIPPTDYGVPRERWKPKEDYRPFNKVYEKPIRAISKTSLRRSLSKLDSPRGDEKFSFENLNISHIDSEITANRLPRIRKLSKDDLNLNNEIKSNILNKSNATPSDKSKPSVALPQSENVSTHSIPFNTIAAESEIMKILEILEISSVDSLKSANNTVITANVTEKLSSIAHETIIRRLSDQMDENEEFDEDIEEIEEIEWSEISDFIQIF